MIRPPFLWDGASCPQLAPDHVEAGYQGFSSLMPSPQGPPEVLHVIDVAISFLEQGLTLWLRLSLNSRNLSAPIFHVLGLLPWTTYLVHVLIPVRTLNTQLFMCDCLSAWGMSGMQASDWMLLFCCVFILSLSLPPWLKQLLVYYPGWSSTPKLKLFSYLNSAHHVPVASAFDLIPSSSVSSPSPPFTVHWYLILSLKTIFPTKKNSRSYTWLRKKYSGLSLVCHWDTETGMAS